jgi:NTP pyrophosphatase (non-canonical NTP hydrolase)
MDIQQYLIDSERTLSSTFYFESDRVQRQLHGAIGISTEITELFQALSTRRMDTINLSEEIADIHWYLAIFQREFGFEVNTNRNDANAISFNSIEDLVIDTAIYSGELLDLYKKWGFYKRNIGQEAVIGLCNRIALNTVVMCDWIGIPLEVALERNIEKLRARFPEKFTEEMANVRDLDTERKILEGQNDKTV